MPEKLNDLFGASNWMTAKTAEGTDMREAAVQSAPTEDFFRSGIPWCAWKPEALNRLFSDPEMVPEHQRKIIYSEAVGREMFETSKITPETVAHGERTRPVLRADVNRAEFLADAIRASADVNAEMRSLDFGHMDPRKPVNRSDEKLKPGRTQSGKRISGRVK